MHVQNNIVAEMLVVKGQLFPISSPWVKNCFYRLRENVIHLKITAVYSFYFTREVDILYPVLYLNFEEKPNGGFLKICEKPPGNIIIVRLKGAIKLAVSIMYLKYWIWKDPISLS